MVVKRMKSMQRIPITWCALTMAMAILPQAGCLTGPSSAGPAENDSSVRGKSELPPAKAAELCLATARELEAKGADAAAIVEYERARHYNPKFTEPVRRLAVLYDRQGDRTHAAAAYTEALGFYPKDADLWNDAGYFQYEFGDLPQAEKFLRQALALKREHRKAWINLGVVLGEERRYDESFQAFCNVLTPAEAHSNVGVILARHGDTAAARAAFQMALAMQPDLKQAHAILSVLDGQANATASSGTP